MIPVVTPDEMRAIDAAAPEPFEVLVERAGAAVARVALEELGGAYGRRVVVICGKAACIERVINDYGPITESRVVDLYKPDFFEVCGCEWWEGITPVTVRVY